MAIGDWKKRLDGSLLVSSLNAWEVGAVPNFGVVRLELAPAKVDGGAEAVTVQVALNDDQLRRIGSAMLKIAEQIESQRSAAN